MRPRLSLHFFTDHTSRLSSSQDLVIAQVLKVLCSYECVGISQLASKARLRAWLISPVTYSTSSTFTQVNGCRSCGLTTMTHLRRRCVTWCQHVSKHSSAFLIQHLSFLRDALCASLLWLQERLCECWAYIAFQFHMAPQLLTGALAIYTFLSSCWHARKFACVLLSFKN
jgi:hypothetical protein